MQQQVMQAKEEGFKLVKISATWLGVLGALVISSTVMADGTWTEKTVVKGDIRYRHESIDAEGKLDRNRQRLRARVGIESKIHPDVKIGVVLASGSDDPVSTNQTLSDGFSTKNVGIDQAFFQWKPSKAKGLMVTGGKIKNPFYKPGKTELIWDGDLRPEGLAAGFMSQSGNARVFVTVAGFWVTESSSGVDAGLRAAQGGLKIHSKDEKTTVIVGGSYFDYSNLEGRPPIFEGFGNSLDGADNYMYDFNLLEVFGEVKHKAGSTPISVFGDFVRNSEPSDNQTGWLIGAKVGKAKKTGQVEGRYNYRKLERDAALGTFSDSDFRGGGTDGQGHEFGLNVLAAKKVKIGATMFINERDLVSKKDYKRFQLDANFKI